MVGQVEPRCVTSTEHDFVTATVAAASTVVAEVRVVTRPTVAELSIVFTTRTRSDVSRF